MADYFKKNCGRALAVLIKTAPAQLRAVFFGLFLPLFHYGLANHPPETETLYFEANLKTENQDSTSPFDSN